ASYSQCVSIARLGNVGGVNDLCPIHGNPSTGQYETNGGDGRNKANSDCLRLVRCPIAGLLRRESGLQSPLVSQASGQFLSPRRPCHRLSRQFGQVSVEYSEQNQYFMVARPDGFEPPTLRFEV